MTPHARWYRQRGGALWLFLLSLLMLGSHFIGKEYGSNAIQHQAKLQNTLNKAKEALIAYAVTETRRPGRLPCPDMIGNGVSPLLSGDECTGYNGWIPWKTLDLNDAFDDRGGTFRYSLSRQFGGDRKQPPINSETPGSLSIENADEIRSDIAAIIIATRGDTDPGNRDDDLLFHVGKTAESRNNDVLAFISRSELMAAVEKRIAGEVRFCLAQYATANGRYPWPAPLSGSNFRGNPGSLFGQIPETQAAPSAEPKISDATRNLLATRDAIAEASNDADQINALKAASTHLAELSAIRLNPWAQAAASLAMQAKTQAIYLAAQGLSIESATTKERISNTEKANLEISTKQIKTNNQKLVATLNDLGLDPFPPHLSEVARSIRSEADRLITQSQHSPAYETMLNQLGSLIELLSASRTANSEISHLLNTADQNARLAYQSYITASAQADEKLAQERARASAEILIDMLDTLKTGILLQRINIHPSDLSEARASLEGAIEKPLSDTTSIVLRQKLLRLKQITESVHSGSTRISNSKNEALLAQRAAIAHIELEPTGTLNSQLTANLLITTGRLEEYIRYNGENLVLESLKAAGENYTEAASNFISARTENQQEILPYAKDLSLRGSELKIWVGLIHAQSIEIARWGEMAQTINTGISRKGETLPDGSFVALQTYIKTPSDSNRALARSSINQTLSGLDQLITSLASFSAGSADAAPMQWASQYCAMLGAESTNLWWGTNDWKYGVFYQIADRYPGENTQLTVNGQGSYTLVAISAGGEAWRENAPCQWTKQSPQQRQSNRRTSAEFFEAGNADPSRDGEARAPTSQFISQPVVQRTRIELNEKIERQSHTSCPSNASLPDTPAFPVTIFNDRLAF